MAEGDETPGGEESAEERIARAREAIDRSWNELSARGGGDPGRPEPPRQPPPPGPPPTPQSATGDPYSAPPVTGGPPSPPPAAPGPDPYAARAAGEAEIERRIAEAADAIDERVRETVSARLSAAERRLELQSQALEAALGEEAVQARLAVEQVEGVRASLRTASETALREVDSAFEQMRERATRELTGQTEERLRDIIVTEARRQEDRLEQRIAEVEREGRGHVRAELEAALGQLRDGAARAAADATDAARTAAEEAISERILPGSGTLEERITSVEAEARGRLQMALDRALEEHGEEMRRRTDSEIARLREEALGEARRAAEAGSAGGVAEGERRLAARIDTTLAETRADTEGRVREAIERLERAIEERGTQLEARIARREGDGEVRLGDRLAELAAQIGTENEAKLAHQLASARADMERSQAERSGRFEHEIGARLESAEARLAAKSDARLAAEAQRIELVGGETERRMRATAEEIEGRWGALRADYEALALRVPAIAEERAAAIASERLAGSGERITAELTSARGELETRVETAFRDVERRLHDEVALRAEAQVVTRAQQQVATQVEGAVAELEARVGAQAERSEGLRSELEAEVARLRSELEEQRGELTKRSIRRERKRLEEEGSAQLAKASELLDARRGEVAAELERHGDGVLARVNEELETGVREAREQLGRAHAGARGELEEIAREQSEEALSNALSRRIDELEGRVDHMLNLKMADAEDRILAVTEAGAQRLAEAERAQEREEAVRERTEAAKAEAEARVRAAEQRLVEVLAQLDRNGNGTPANHG